MIHKGGHVLLGGKIAIYPSLTEAAFLSSDLGKVTELRLSNAGYHRYHAVSVLENGMDCYLSVTFFDGTLYSANLSPHWPGSPQSWAEWNLESELDAKKTNDALLGQTLGPPPYAYSWGKVESSYDQKGGASAIHISYFGSKQTRL
jgi:hypothetical protein